MSSADAVLAEARKAAQAGDLKRAAAVLDGANEKAKGAGGWAYARGTVAMQLGAVKEAVGFFELAVQREPEVAEYRSNLGGALLELSKAGDAAAGKRALEELELAVQWGPTTPHVHTNLGLAKLLNGDARGALSALDLALRIDPKHVPALYNRAAAYSKMGRSAESLETLDELLTIDPKFEPALKSRANELARKR